MGEKTKKFIVFFLAILTVLAFSPFIFSSPNSSGPSTPVSDENPKSSTTTATSTQN